MINRETYYNLQDAIDFVTDGNISELSDLSDLYLNYHQMKVIMMK